MTTLQALAFNVAAGSALGLASLFGFGVAVVNQHEYIAPRCAARPPTVIYNTSYGSPLLGWIPWTLRQSYETLLQGIPGTGTRQGGHTGSLLRCNLDAIVLLRFHAVGLKVSAVATLLCLGLLFPLYWTSECHDVQSGGSDANTENPDSTTTNWRYDACAFETNNLTGYEQTTIANVPSYLPEEAEELLDTDGSNFYHQDQTLIRLYAAVFTLWILTAYLLNLLKREWIELLALRRVYYLEANVWGERKQQLQETLRQRPVTPQFYSGRTPPPPDSLPECDSLLRDNEEDEHSKRFKKSKKGQVTIVQPENDLTQENTDEIYSQHTGGERGLFRRRRRHPNRRRRRRRLLGHQPFDDDNMYDVEERHLMDRDPWIPHPEQRDTVSNIQLYSVLVGGLPSLPDFRNASATTTNNNHNGSPAESNLTPDHTTNKNSNYMMDWQLALTSAFFDHCVPNQPGFSSSVAAVTLLPSSKAIATAWSKWYKAASKLRRLKFIRAQIAKKFHYDEQGQEEDEFDLEDDNEDDEEEALDDEYSSPSRVDGSEHEASRHSTTSSSRVGRRLRNRLGMAGGGGARSNPHDARSLGIADGGSLAGTDDNSTLGAFLPAVDLPPSIHNHHQQHHTATTNKNNNKNPDDDEESALRDPSLVSYAYYHNDPEELGPLEVAAATNTEQQQQQEEELLQALLEHPFGPEQTAIYSREVAQSAAACCPNGCWEGAVLHATIDELLVLEREAAENVHKANLELYRARQEAVWHSAQPPPPPPTTNTTSHSPPHMSSSSPGPILTTTTNSQTVVPAPTRAAADDSSADAAPSRPFGATGVPTTIQTDSMEMTTPAEPTENTNNLDSTLDTVLGGQEQAAGPKETISIKGLATMPPLNSSSNVPPSSRVGHPLQRVAEESSFATLDVESIQQSQTHESTKSLQSSSKQLTTSKKATTTTTTTNNSTTTTLPPLLPEDFATAAWEFFKPPNLEFSSMFTSMYESATSLNSNSQQQQQPVEPPAMVERARSAPTAAMTRDRLPSDLALEGDLLFPSHSNVPPPPSPFSGHHRSGSMPTRHPQSMWGVPPPPPPESSSSFALEETEAPQMPPLQTTSSMDTPKTKTHSGTSPMTLPAKKVDPDLGPIQRSGSSSTADSASLDDQDNSKDKEYPNNEIAAPGNYVSWGYQHGTTTVEAPPPARTTSEKTKWEKVQSIVASTRAAMYSSRRRRLRSSSKRTDAPSHHTPISGVWHGRPSISDLMQAAYSRAKALSRFLTKQTTEAMDLSRESSYAVVTFTSRQAALAARKCLADARGGTERWKTDRELPIPPLADAAAWDLCVCRNCCRPVAISIDTRQKTWRHYFSLLLLAAFYALATFPLTIVASLMDPQTLERAFPNFFEWADRNQEGTAELTSGFLQSLMWTIFFALCPVFFKMVANFGSKANSVANAELRALQYFWWFMVVSAFSSTLIANMVLFGFNEGSLGGELRSILRSIARAIPSTTAAMWLNWLIFRTTVTMPALYLLQVNSFLFDFFGFRCCSRLSRGGGPGPPPPYRLYVDSGVVLMCLLALATASPLVAPAAFCYFMLCQPLLRRCCIFVYRPKFDGGGLRWPFIFDMIVSSLFVGQILLTIQMVLKQAVGPAVASAAPLLPTLLAVLNMKKKFLPAYRDVALLQTSLLDGWDSTSQESSSMEKREEFRRFLVDAHKAAYIPVCLASTNTRDQPDMSMTAEPAVVVPKETDIVRELLHEDDYDDHPKNNPNGGSTIGDRQSQSELGTASASAAAWHVMERRNQQYGATLRRAGNTLSALRQRASSKASHSSNSLPRGSIATAEGGNHRQHHGMDSSQPALPRGGGTQEGTSHWNDTDVSSFRHESKQDK